MWMKWIKVDVMKVDEGAIVRSFFLAFRQKPTRIPMRMLQNLANLATFK